MCSKLHKDLGKPALLSLRLGKTPKFKRIMQQE